MDRRARIAEADKRYVFRPYTGTEEHANEVPLVVGRAEGAKLYDLDGRAFYDASGAWWTNNLGYQNPRIVEAIKRQAETLCHAPLAAATHAPAAELAEALVTQMPGMARVFYSDDGSTAIEVAVKIVFQVFAQNGDKKRTRFLALPSGYHGDTIGAMSVGPLEAFTKVHGPLLFDVARAPEPVDGDFEPVFAWLERELEAHGPSIAGVFVEPLVQGSAGMRFYPPALLARLSAATHRAGALLVVDEVFTGFGRTGSMFAHMQAGIVPDVVCLAKGLSAGMLPFAATLVTERVYDAFRGDKKRALMHGHTFCGNPLGAAVALEVLRIYEEEAILERAKPNEARLAERMHAIGAIDGVTNARALGSIAALDLGAGDYFSGAGPRAAAHARAHGMLLRPLGNTLYLIPPLLLPMHELDEMLDLLEAAVRHAL